MYFFLGPDITVASSVRNKDINTRNAYISTHINTLCFLIFILFIYLFLNFFIGV